MTLSSLSHRAALILVAASSLLAVACAGESAAPTYSPTDAEGELATGASAPQGGEGAECEAGETRACKLFLGQHGDVSNCVEGLDVCSAGEWTGCIDEASLVENPELLSQLGAR